MFVTRLTEKFYSFINRLGDEAVTQRARIPGSNHPLVRRIARLAGEHARRLAETDPLKIRVTSSHFLGRGKKTLDELRHSRQVGRVEVRALRRSSAAFR